MSGRLFSARRARTVWWAAGAAIVAATWVSSSALAQNALPPNDLFTSPTVTSNVNGQHVPSATDATEQSGAIVQAGCHTCGGGLFGGSDGTAGNCAGGCDNGDCAQGCTPGRTPCGCCGDADTCIGRMFCGLYQCICCPDPCYDPPHWLGVADAAFFVDAARPITQMRLRNDTGFDLPLADRAEFFWARADGKGKGPKPPTNAAGAKIFDDSLSLYRDYSVYMEAASDRFSFFFEIPYEELDPNFYAGHSGFSDINLGTKSLLLDCELMQLAFQFRTFLPSGQASKGLGTGHVSLEPSLLGALRLTPVTYLQSQVAYWIPVGGDTAYEGAVFHYHLSLNQILWQPCRDVQLIGTGELNGWEIMSGEFTDPNTGTPLSAKDESHIVSMGPGVRLVICDKIDFGVGSAFAVSHHHWAEELIRGEFRWRF